MSDEYFIRALDIRTDSDNESTLNFQQKSVGDVNCIVWDAAIVLAKYLEKINGANDGFLSDLEVVELGAGVGCAGLVAACLGANVTLTDLPEALPILEKNIKINKNLLKGTAREAELKWGEKYDGETPNLILLADCVYYEESVEDLIDTLIQLCDSNTEVVQVQEMRDSDKQREVWKGYMEKLSEHFEVDEIPLSEQNVDYSSEDIKVFVFKKL